MTKSQLKPLLKIKKRMHICALKVTLLSEDRKNAMLEINGVPVDFYNLESADFLSFWKDSPSASAMLLREIKRAYDEAPETEVKQEE